MEVLRKCQDLNQRLEREIGTRRLSLVSQDDSRAIIASLARSLGANPLVMNLFPLTAPLTSGEYVLFINDRLKEFAPAPQVLDLRSALDEAEDAAFAEPADELQEIPIPTTGRTLGTMMSQVNQWQKDNAIGKSAAIAAAEATAEADDSDDSDDEPVATTKKRDDSDSDDEDIEEDTEDDTPPVLDVATLCTQLLNDRTAMSQFTKDSYALVNPHNERKIDINGTQPFLDSLVDKGFEIGKLKGIIQSLLTSEFAHIRDLNYVHFCVFVRYVLQRYTL